MFSECRTTGSGSAYAPVVDAYKVRMQRGLSDNAVRNKLDLIAITRCIGVQCLSLVKGEHKQ
jgi:hypothetical protein